MKPIYAMLFQFIQWYAFKVDQVAYWLYLRLIDYELDDEEQFENTSELAPRNNSVHIPRRELH
jgi:hypothetical protein